MGRATNRSKNATKKDSNILEESKMSKASALGSLKTLIPGIFMDAQRPNEHLRSDSIRLRDVQLACCLNLPRLIGESDNIDYEGEEQFINEVFRNINKALPIRKKEPHADRIVRFIAGFLHYNQQRDANAKAALRKWNKRKAKKEAKRLARIEANGGTEDDDLVDEEESEEEEEEGGEAELEEDYDDEDEAETISSRFIEKLLRHLLRGFSAKKLFVRIRCCNIVAMSISSMGEIDENLYQDLKEALFERFKDKEASVRMQTVTALCRLQNADTDVDPSDGKTILQKLMWTLQYDPNSEVRRVILFNIDPVPETLPYIVERARDLDPINRRVVYLKPLSDIPDFRVFGLEERNQILEWGLNDRNALVRKAATKMLCEKWIGHANNNLLEFLERLEVMKPKVSDIAESVLNAFFVSRLDIVSDFSFDDEFWANLSPESALLAKVLIKFLQKDSKLHDRLDAILPEVTRHAFNLQYYNDLYRSASAEEMDYEYITTQMLETALYLDYADEAGRRKMYELLRDILKSCELIDDHLAKIVKIFRLISLDERDFSRTIIEIISDIQEQLNPFDDLEETPAKRSRLDAEGSSLSMDVPDIVDNTQNMDSNVIRLRCLNICKRMLENSQESLTENSNLYGLLNDLIVPAVQNSDPVLREEGLHCLGLCCTLDKTLAQHNLSLFIHCIKNGHEDIVKKAIMILFDLMMTYGVQNLSTQIANPDEVREVFEFCLDHDSSEIQSITTEGLAKLMLAKRFADDEILRLMVLLYFFPTTDTVNNKIQQCLTYFFPAYCYSSADHQKSMSNIVISALEELCNTFNDLAKDETMVNPMQISDMLADWTDPRKLAKLHIGEYDEDEAKSDIPGTLAIDTLKLIYSESAGIKRKTMCHFLLRLNLEKQNESQLEEIRKLITNINNDCPIKEVLTRNAFVKLAAQLDLNAPTTQSTGADQNSTAESTADPTAEQSPTADQSPIADQSPTAESSAAPSPAPIDED